MNPLNYHHLRIFWTVARSGSLRAAAEEMRLSQPTLSTQLKDLENALGSPLFVRAGRRLTLTEQGRIALGYANEIFFLGTELGHAIDRRDSTRARRLNVGITESLPKLVAHEILRPAFSLDPEVRVVCQEGTLEDQAVRLADFRLDVILADEAMPGGRLRGVFNHCLGGTGALVVGTPGLARKYRPGFPSSLDGAPMVLPTEAAPMRRGLEHWFLSCGMRPRCVAEFDDSALMMDFAAEGVGVAAIYAVTEQQTLERYGLERIGKVKGLYTEFYAISVERRLRDSAVLAITEQAQQGLFRLRKRPGS